MRHTVLRPALTALAAILATAGWTQALETGMGNLVYCDTVEGDFATAGASTRVWDGAQTPVFDLTVSSLPANATVVAAYANWSYLGNTAPAINNILVNNQAVQGNRSGLGERDLVWGKDKAFAYTADVTSIFTQNGTYNIKGATDNDGAGRIGEGLSVVMVYELPNAMEKLVHVYDGYTSTTTGEAKADLMFCGEANDRGAHFFANALDGQEIFSDDFYVDGVLMSGVLTDGAVGNAFQGTLGPGARDYNYYDHAEGFVPLVPGQLSMTFETDGWDDEQNLLFTDAIGHSFSAVSFIPVPEPGTVIGLVMGVAALGRGLKSQKEGKK